MVMEGCISSIIDLHSSDDLEIYQVYNLFTYYNYNYNSYNYYYDDSFLGIL